MYKRLIVYLYYYKDGEKQENCGYMKINIHNGECRMDVHIMNLPQIEGEMGFYLLKKKDEKLTGREVMKGVVNEGSMNLKYDCKCNNMADNISIDEVIGVLIYNGENIEKSICGAMKAEEIHPLDFEEEEDLEVEEIQMEQEDNSVYEYDEDCLKEKEEKGAAECMDERVEGCSTALNDMENSHIGPVGSWQEKIFHVFPKTVVNINGEKTSGIKLKPHDIVWFPGRYWRLASNKFLLNGYYNYRYILFFKGTGEHEGRYYLGTPGNFGVNNAITAKQFGFTDFFAANGCNDDEKTFHRKDERNFGFWCREA